MSVCSGGVGVGGGDLCVFICAVWEVMGVQVVSSKVWYLSYTSMCHRG